MPARRFPLLAGLGTVITLGLGVSAPAHAASVHVIHPGQSVQQAVDSAKPGDTIVLLPGSYPGSVLVTVPGLTIRGVGHASVITPAAATSPAATNACAQAGHGVCVTGTAGHRVTGVSIESLTVAGFPKNGVSGSETDRMTVRGVLVQDNGEQGISQEKSTRGRLTDNQARRNGQAGIFLANIAYGKGGAIDTEGAVISDNVLSGNRIGTVVRRARNLTVERNTITGNCAGVFVVGDDGTPRAGALSVRGNRVNENNRWCPPNDRLPYLQGIGIVLTGVEQTLVTQNQVDGNVGASPLSGGIVLFRSFVGGPSTGNTISDNVAVGNGPADLADRDSGVGNTFTRNDCRVSAPAGRC